MQQQLIDIAPVVQFAPCDEYEGIAECPWCTCEACGWLEADHAMAVGGLQAA